MREQGRKIRATAIDVRVLASKHSFPRIGIVVPRFGQTVVERNRLKRRLRELARTQLLPVLPPQDVLLRAHPATYRESFAALRAEVVRLAGQLTAAESR